MEQLYRGYRIATRQTDRWVARVTHVGGTYVPLDAQSSLHEGAEACLTRARDMIDRYIAFLEQNGIGGTPN